MSPDAATISLGSRRELYLTATDLDTCERVVFGRRRITDVPISTAVRASGALPMVYAPVTVGERELVDGGLVSTTNLDIAVQAGAKLIVVINPIVPYVNDFSETVRTLSGVRAKRVSDMGFPQIGYQAFKLLAHQRLHEMAELWEERYPGVDIVLIEPEPADKLMFQTSIMSYASRVEIARHGFETVTQHIAREYERYATIAERHGLDISGERLRRVVAHFDDVEPEPGERVAKDPRGDYRARCCASRGSRAEAGALTAICRSRPAGARSAGVAQGDAHVTGLA